METTQSEDWEDGDTVTPGVVWQEDEEATTYTADVADVNGHRVSVCLDDEGPYNPAFYWDIDNRAIDGWASSVRQARIDAVAQARSL